MAPWAVRKVADTRSCSIASSDPLIVRARRCARRDTLDSMKRSVVLVLTSIALAACERSSPDTTRPDEGSSAPQQQADPLAGRAVVPNPDARVGDVTICPYSGRKFVVEPSSPRWEYEGTTYVFCAEKALLEVQKDPTKYLGDARR